MRRAATVIALCAASSASARKPTTFEPTPMAGPFASLEALCAAEKPKGDPRACVWGPPRPELEPTAGFDEAKLGVVPEGLVAIHALALRVAGSWYTVELHRGDQDITRQHRITSERTGAMIESPPDARYITAKVFINDQTTVDGVVKSYGSSQTWVACGIGPSKKPSCTDTVPTLVGVGATETRALRTDLTSEGVTFAQKAGKPDANQRAALGFHRLIFE